MQAQWFVRRRPNGTSFLRDGFPYLEANLPEGAMWAQTRKEACAFTTLKAAQQALKLARRFEPEAYVVRVTAS